MPCANRDGSNKLPLIFLGTAQNPRSLPRDKSLLPVYYRSSKKAWMNRNLFKEWFHEQFVPSVQVFSEKQGIEPVALLLLDNCSAHHEDEFGELSSADGKITVMFLPPNCTSLGQPMDQGVINWIKKRYKKTLLLNVILADDDVDLDSRLKRISLLDSIVWLAQAWDDVPSSVISNSWNKLWKPSNPQEHQIEDILECQIKEDEELNELIRSVEKVGNFHCSADEIDEWQNDWVRDSLNEWVTGDTSIYTDREIIDYVNGSRTFCEHVEVEDDSLAEEWLDEEHYDAECTGILQVVDHLICYLNGEGMVEDTIRMKIIKNKIMQHEFAKRM